MARIKISPQTQIRLLLRSFVLVRQVWRLEKEDFSNEMALAGEKSLEVAVWCGERKRFDVLKGVEDGAENVPRWE